jgi:NTP pyrophosphatase (non-canonical NTP hydrolase)
MSEMGDLQYIIHANAVAKLWWSDNTRNFMETLMLVVSEIAEAGEEYRDGRALNEVYYHGSKPEGIPVELADAVIRILDFCEWAGIDLYTVIQEKHAYNLTREPRHGGKLA